jgi:protein subunit release factor B
MPNSDAQNAALFVLCMSFNRPAERDTASFACLPIDTDQRDTSPEGDSNKIIEEIQMSRMEMSPEELEKLKREVEIDFYKSHGPGGQRKNKRETAVRIRHIPTGITVIATESRYQGANLSLALQRLYERIRKLQEPKVPRRATKTPSSAKRIRLMQKKKRGRIKSLRKGPSPSGDMEL